MAHTPFDLLVIGGGITGAAIAWDASLRGLRVGLVEKQDFAGATTAASSRLIHGGLRYLRNFEFGLVRESLRERRIWQRIAPHMVTPLKFYLPTASWRQGLMLRAGLTLYDLLSFDRNQGMSPDKILPGHDALTPAMARKAMVKASVKRSQWALGIPCGTRHWLAVSTANVMRPSTKVVSPFTRGRIASAVIF